MIEVVASLAIFVTQTPQDWRYVAATEDAFVGVDLSRVSTVNGRKRFWSVHAMLNPARAGYDSMIGLSEIDCEEGTVRVLQGTVYHNDGTNEDNTGFGRTTYIIPGTVNEAVQAAVCSGVVEGRTGVGSVQDFIDAARTYD
jgi:hypothetical protein